MQAIQPQIKKGFEILSPMSQWTSTSQPLLCEIYNFNRFKGRYFLSGYLQKVDRKGEPFVEITLSDSSDTTKLYCRDRSCIIGELAPESFVNVEAQFDNSGDIPYFRVKYIETCDVNRPLAMNQLPVSRCRHPSSFSGLFDLVGSIKNRALQQFVENVFCLENIGVRFIQCPASRKLHHNYHGGLLVHSLEVAQLAEKNKYLSADNRDLLIVAAIFHDIGKTLTLTPDLTYTDIGLFIAHDQLTLEICAGALKILQARNARFAMHLRHAWTCESDSAQNSYKAKTRIARLLKKADGISAFGPPT